MKRKPERPSGYEAVAFSTSPYSRWCFSHCARTTRDPELIPVSSLFFRQPSPSHPHITTQHCEAHFMLHYCAKAHTDFTSPDNSLKAMALSNTIGRAQRSTPRPVLPALPTGGVSLRSSAKNSPQNTPTVLEDSTLEDNGGVKLSTTPEGTPPGYQRHNSEYSPVSPS